PAYGPQNDVTLKMPAFEWVHVQLHQQKGMISLSPPTICNSASQVVHARTTSARRKGLPANQQPLYKGASVVRPASVLKRRACARLQVATYRIRKP
ncbi:hypothetical protein ACUX6Y_24890, partial [Salmonella enterica]